MMSKDYTGSLPRARGTNPGGIRTVWWMLSVVLTFYTVTLSLICIDEYILDHRLILGPMQTYTPDLIEPLCSLCTATYRPVAFVMQALQISA